MTDAQALAATVMEAHGKALDGATSNIPSAYGAVMHWGGVMDDALAELVRRVEAAEQATADPESWRDDKGHLRGFVAEDDPRDALNRLGYIHANLVAHDEAQGERRYVAVEALRLADAQIERAEAAERDRDKR